MWGTRGQLDHAEHGCRFIPTHVGNTYRDTGKWGVYSVHPHACGEHVLLIATLRFLGGSSPRMWGTLLLRPCSHKSTRFIPTHVGNTPWPDATAICIAVHPHACGEHSICRVIHRCLNGSSPRMWGTLIALPCLRRCQRFIPTHVGNTLFFGRLPCLLSVHPHACGEHS